jgi:hypothetical protein
MNTTTIITKALTLRKEESKMVTNITIIIKIIVTKTIIINHIVTFVKLKDTLPETAYII